MKPGLSRRLFVKCAVAALAVPFLPRPVRHWLNLQTFADRMDPHTRAQVAKLLTEANDALEDMPWETEDMRFRTVIAPSQWADFRYSSRGL